MLFTQSVFFLFFVVVYLLYLRLPFRGQNLMLLCASYFFYGWWDVRFLLLLLTSTTVDYFCAGAIQRATVENRRRAFLLVSLVVNLGALAFFKYFDFFVSSLHLALTSAGFDVQMRTLGIIVPVGISFYTFQTLSYTIDVFKRTVEPRRNFIDFALYVCFFPQLVAGPIERPSRLLVQIERPRLLRADVIREGLQLLVQGFFLKMVVADNAAKIVDSVFAVQEPTAPQVLLGTYAFALQIYGDFGGYSRIARGLARLMGFSLTQNFRQPYFSSNASEFWTRWHITLSTWLRDYLYIPLGGNRHGARRTLLHLMITMLLGGLWHGAAWNFVAWGAFHGLLLIAFHGARPYLEKARIHRIPRWIRVAFFFHLVCVGWLLFRAPNIDQAWTMLSGLMDAWPVLSEMLTQQWQALAALAFAVLLYDLHDVHLEKCRESAPSAVRWPRRTLDGAAVVAQLLLIFLAGNRHGSEFIYFQF